MNAPAGHKCVKVFKWTSLSLSVTRGWKQVFLSYKWCTENVNFSRHKILTGRALLYFIFSVKVIFLPEICNVLSYFHVNSLRVFVFFCHELKKNKTRSQYYQRWSQITFGSNKAVYIDEWIPQSLYFPRHCSEAICWNNLKAKQLTIIQVYLMALYPMYNFRWFHTPVILLYNIKVCFLWLSKH